MITHSCKLYDSLLNVSYIKTKNKIEKFEILQFEHTLINFNHQLL